MPEKDNFTNIVQDMSFLYELALAVGQSLSLEENCDRFLKRLMGRKGLGYGAVWVYDRLLKGSGQEDGATLVYANPASYARTKNISYDHPLFRSLCKEKYRIVQSCSAEFELLIDEDGIDCGTYILIALEEVGILKLFSYAEGEPFFSRIDLKKIENVLLKFAVSLKSCLLYEQLSSEMDERKRISAILEKNEKKHRQLSELLEAVLNGIPDIIGVQQPDHTIVRYNQAGYNFLGMTPEEVVEKKCYELIGRNIECDLCTTREALISNKVETSEKYFPELALYLDCQSTPLKDENGQVVLIVEQLRDITGRKRMEEALRDSEEQFRQITENMIDVVWLFSADNTKMIYISPSYEQIWGRSCQSLYDNPLSFMDTVYAEDMEKVQAEFNRSLETMLFDLEYRIARPDGELRWVHARSYPVRNSFGEIVNHAGTAVDITERKTAEEELLFLSQHDQLTRLYSRFHFEQLISEPLQADTLPLCIVMADLNGLKLVNDAHGNHLGDEMLKKAALLIRQACRDEDIIARWGGDEFAILIHKSTVKDAEGLIKKIVKSCKGQFIEDIPLSMTMGVACKTEATGDLFLTLREAENNLARHKLTEARSAKHAVLQALLKTLAAKSYETEAHTRRMQQVARAIGEKVNLAEADLSRLNLIINLHDIGKINIAEAILTKESALSEEEWQSIKTHPEVGYRIARATEEFAHVAEDILAHHERWDGSGYPRGLRGEEIPLLARITAIADAFEVMSNGRPYKEKMSKAEIRAEFEKCAGYHFDPALVAHFLSILDCKVETVDL